jgi:pilus assembly protein CpaB
MRGGILITFAIVVGLIAAGMVYLRLTRSEGSDPMVVVAAQNISAGSTIYPEQLEVIRWGAPGLPSQVFRDAASVTGRVARVDIAQGSVIVAGSLARPNSMNGLSSVIGEGWRAISIEANEISGVAGFIAPGSYVDLLVSGKDLAQKPFSQIVLDRVRVLAVEQDTKADPQEPRIVRAVTLELTPDQTERLDLARSIGTLSLALRNEFDRAPVRARGARLEDLLVNGEEAVQAPPAPATQVRLREPAASPSDRGEGLRAPRGVPVEEIRGTGAGA